MHGESGLGRSLTDPEGHRWRCTECQTGWGRSAGEKVLGCAEHFPAPGALEGAELLVSLLRLGPLRQDGTPRVTPLANPSWGPRWGGVAINAYSVGGLGQQILPPPM